jgi:nitrogen regulatory protein PII
MKKIEAIIKPFNLDEVREALIEIGALRTEKWLGAESNRRHEDFQSSALPTELPSRVNGERAI